MSNITICHKGDWVEISRQVLSIKERSPAIPSDTALQPLMLWCRGYLTNEEALIGNEAEIVTLSGRLEKGILKQINPSWTHSFGDSVPELTQLIAGICQLRTELFHQRKGGTR